MILVTEFRLCDAARWYTWPRMRGRHGKIGRAHRRQSGRSAWLSLFLARVSVLFCLGGIAQPGLAEERLKIAGFSFSTPSIWVRQATTSNMRAAQFLVPNTGSGYDGIVIFFRFPPGLGGSAERNIARWYSQFKEPKELLKAAVETRDREGRRLHYFRATGTLIGRDGDMPNYALHAALLDGPTGRVFVRFVAPKAVARSNQAVFRDLIITAFGSK